MSFHFERAGLRRWVAGSLSVLLVLAFVFSALPQVAFAAEDATCTKSYTVVSGDTLSTIAAKYSTTVAQIASDNSLKEPYTLYVGQQLCVAGAAAATSTGTSSTSGSTSSSNTKSSKDPDMTLSVTPGFLTIKTANFPTKSNFYIKISPNIRRESSSYTKIGLLKTKKEGSVTKTFKLPKDFNHVASISVCVKNAMTDDTLCRSVSTGFK